MPGQKLLCNAKHSQHICCLVPLINYAGSDFFPYAKVNGSIMKSTLLKLECNHNTLQVSICMFKFNTKGTVKRVCDDTKRGSGIAISVIARCYRYSGVL